VVVESTFSGRTFQRVIESAKDAGFDVTILFLWLDSADSSLARVKERVAKGGHDVPEEDIRRRFPRSLSSFWNLYRPSSHQWNLTYNGSHQSQAVAFGKPNSSYILNAELFGRFLQLIDCSSND
jgi:predicted ABC-type ATPase